MALSTTATAQLANACIDTYVSCKMYDYDDVYVCNLNVEQASYSKSREFGISILRLTVVNSGNQYSIGGTFEAKQGYKVVLIEGFNTTTNTDKFPKFKGYIENITVQTKAGDSIITMDIYDELIVTKKSDIDKIYMANYNTISGEQLVPVIDNPITTVLQNASGESVLFRYSELNANRIDSQVSIGSFYVGSSIFKINSIADAPYLDSNKLLVNELKWTWRSIGLPMTISQRVYYTTQVGLAVGDTIVSKNNEFSAVITGSGTDSIGSYLVSTNGNGPFFDGQTIYKSGNLNAYVVVLAFMHVKAVRFDNLAITAAGGGIVTNDKVHNGMISLYRAQFDNWVQFKSHKIRIEYNGFETGNEKNSGFETIHKKGIIRLNEPTVANAQRVYADYTYFPVGLYAEDVISNILTLDDQFQINLITNGNFSELSYNWITYTQGTILVSDYSTLYKDGVDIDINATFAIGEGVGIKQSTSYNLTKGKKYTISFEGIKRMGTENGSVHLALVNSNFASQTYTASLYSITPTKQTITYTPTVDETGVYPIIWLSGATSGQKWNISDVRITYNPAKINTLSSGSLYTSVHIANGSATTAYSMVKATDYVRLPDYTILTDNIDTTTATMHVKSTTDFDPTGYISVDNEIIQYASKTSGTFSGITRGALNTIQTEHTVGTRILHTVSAARVWYTQYSNIIPKASSVTASTYNSTSGVNVGSATSFSITGAGKFKKFFYRNGLLLLSGVATAVSHNANNNYYFNYIQATGIEIPYILIDQTKVKTKFDALNVIRKLIAPNYVIDVAVRSTATDTYTSLIRGRYLTQKVTQDFNLSMMGDVSYTSSPDTYNRVKMFGKNALPENLLYNNKTNIISVNDIGSQYVKNVPVNYVGVDNGYFIYKFRDSRSYIGLSKDKGFYYSNFEIGSRSLYKGNYIETVRSISTGEDDPHTTPMDNGSIGDNKIIFFNNLGTFTNIITGGIYSYTIKYGSTYAARTMKLDLYNVYLIKYTLSGVNWSIGDAVGNGTIAFIKNVSNIEDYDQLIYVRHANGGSLFLDSSLQTNGTNTANVYLPIVDGFIAQSNVNTTTQSKTVKIRGLYDVTDYTMVEDVGTKATPNNLISDINNTIIYVNDIKLNDEPKWIYKLIDFERNPTPETTSVHDGYTYFLGIRSEKHITRKWWKKEINTLDIYVADTLKESELLGYDDNNALRRGSVLFESVTENSKSETKLRLLFKDPQYWNTNVSDTEGNRTLGEQLTNGDYLYYDWKRNVSPNFVQTILRDTNRISFYQKKKYDIDWDIEGDYLYLNKVDVEKYWQKIEDVNVTVDGEFCIRVSTDMISTKTMPSIDRIRDWTKVGTNQQIAIASKRMIENISLFVIDFGSVEDIGYIDIQPGYFYKPPEYNDNTKYDSKFKLTLQYSDSDTPFDIGLTFSNINDKTTSIEMSTGEAYSFTKADLGERFKARHIKFIVDCDESVTEEYKLTENKNTTEIINKWYGASIGGVAVYKNDLLVSEQYVASNLINLYKDTTVYEELYTQDMVDRYAQAVLNEFQKNHTLAQVSVPWSPHLEVGQTVNINDTMNGVNRNYFIEGINSNNGVLNIDLAYYP